MTDELRNKLTDEVQGWFALFAVVLFPLMPFVVFVFAAGCAFGGLHPLAFLGFGRVKEPKR